VLATCGNTGSGGRRHVRAFYTVRDTDSLASSRVKSGIAARRRQRPVTNTMRSPEGGFADQ
jgi:hypothetical protein